MTTARVFNRIIRRKLSRHAAWLPVLSPFALGDYGYYDGGVFRRIGNVRDALGVDFDAVAGGNASLDFQTRRGAEVSFHVEGQGKVPQLPDTDVQARIEYAFTGARSILLKAPLITSTAIADVAAVAQRLDALPSQQWNRRYKLVTELLVAERATMAFTESRDTTVAISGTASMLRRFDLGQVGAGVGVSANRTLALQIEGERGPCALGLARVRRGQPVVEALVPGAATFEVELADDDDDDFEAEDDV